MQMLAEDLALSRPFIVESGGAIVVPRRDGTIDRVLASQIPGAKHISGPGRWGWNAAVLSLLDGSRLLRSAARA